MIFKLPRLPVNWVTQTELVRRYWDQAMTAIETPNLIDAPDDAAAAALDVGVGRLYRTGNVVKIRLS